MCIENKYILVNFILLANKCLHYMLTCVSSYSVHDKYKTKMQ